MANLAGNLPYCHHRYAFFVSYLGTRYNGSQRLVARGKRGNQDTIQEAIEHSLENFMSVKKCRLTAASRTDKGVHALMNCYTLPLKDYEQPTERMKHEMNRILARRNHDIIVKQVLLVPADFHPRKAALSREYIYRIAVPDRFRTTELMETHQPDRIIHRLPVTELYKLLPLPCLDLDRVEKAIELMRGEHDFASFCFGAKVGDDTLRTMEIGLTTPQVGILDNEVPKGFTIYHLHFKSRAFLYNQIRRLVGTIISYATYRHISFGDIQRMFERPTYDWNPKIIIAEPWGLFLSRINYPREAFEGTIITYPDRSEEKIRSIPGIVSDDDNEEGRTKQDVDIN